MKEYMKKILAIITVIAIAIPSACFGAVENFESYYFWDGNGYYSYSQSPYEISIIYTGDMRGNFDSNKKGDMARVMTKIRELRRYYPDSYLFDAGNFMGKDNSFGSKLSQSYELKAMETMAYDAVSLGQKELSNAPETLSKLLEGAIDDKVNTKDYFAYPKLLCSNLSWDNLNNGELKKQIAKFTPDIDYAIIEKYSSKLAVVSVTEPDKELKEKGYELEDTTSAVNDLVKSIKKKNKDIQGVVALYNGDDSSSFAEGLKNVNLVIASAEENISSQKDLAEDVKPEKVGNTKVVKTYGTSGVGHIVFNVDGKKLKVESCQSYKVDDDVYQNPAITELEDDYNKEVDKSYFGLFGFSQKEKLTSTSVKFESIEDLQKEQGNSTLGNLISDAYSYTGGHYSSDSNEVAGAFFALGTLKNSLSSGSVTVKDVYNMFDKEYGTDGLSGKELVSVYVSGAELKILAEIDASISEGNSDVRLYSSGLYYEYNPNRFSRNKVSKVWLGGKDKENVKDRNLYKVITDVDTINLINSANKAPFGLMDIEFKDKEGNPIEDINNAVIMKGSHPLKQWVAVAKYIDAKGISSSYKNAEDRKILNDDSSIKAIFKNPGKVFIVTALAAVIGIALIVLLIAIVISIIRRALGIKKSSFYRKARKANNQKSIFKHRKNRYTRRMKYRKESWIKRKLNK